jgi:large subunit ribosomal protein L21
MAAAVTAVGTLTGRRRKRRAERRKARDQRRARKAQRRAQRGGGRPSGTAVPAIAASAPAEPSSEAARSGGAFPSESEGDDLRAIRGLGAVAAEKLRGAGVTTWAQVAAWTPDEARDLALRLGLQPGRIASDDWVGQAQRLIEEREQGPVKG